MTEGRHKHKMSDSFLVRCWKEPREVAGQADVIRFYVRNLRTGEEHYISESSQVGGLLERGLQESAAAPAVHSEPGRGSPGSRPTPGSRATAGR